VRRAPWATSAWWSGPAIKTPS